ncbi:MAG: glycosyltransferase family 2 protein [Sphingobacteriaceae bacterium]|jgi:GT2 family glycosyltransferase
MQTVAVVILNYNGKAFLEKFLSNVIAFSAPHEVIVADNASTDDSLVYLKQNFPQIKVLANSNNDGYAKGYNVALKQINVDYFILLNNDVEVTPNWIEPLLTLMKQNEKIAVCQPKLIDQKNKTLFEYAGGSGGFIDKYGYPFCRGRVFNDIETDNGQYNDAIPVFWASGACMMVSSDVYWKAGGLDDDYFAHMEEIDLCWRIKNMGYDVFVQPQSTVYHVGGGTLQKISARKTYLNFRNNLITLVKDHPSKGLFLKFVYRLILDGIAGTKFFLSLQPSHCFAVVRAHFAFYFSIGTTLRKRKELKTLPNYTHTFSPVYDRNIVFDHFVKGVKKFSDLKGKFN